MCINAIYFLYNIVYQRLIQPWKEYIEKRSMIYILPLPQLTNLTIFLQISNGYHMDRGLNLVLQAGPANARLTRFLFVTPCFCVTPPQRSHCLPKHRHWTPRCDNTIPFASIRLGLGLPLTSTIGRYRLTLKTCAVPGTQEGWGGVLSERVRSTQDFPLSTSFFGYARFFQCLGLRLP